MMGKPYVTLVGWEEFQTRLQRPKEAIVSKWLDQIGMSVHNAIRKEAPKKTGDLRKSVELTSRGPLVREITEGKRYGIFVRRGTAEHFITPRFKRALYWDGLAHPIAWTIHPGTKPNPYHARGVERGQAVRKNQKLLKALGSEIVMDIAK